MIDAWLLRATIDVSLLIAVILLVRPLVRRALGASAAYWLWFLPLLRLVVIDRPDRPSTIPYLPSTPTFGVESLTSVNETLAPQGLLLACWLAGIFAWSVVRVTGWARFRRALAIQSQRIALPGHLSAVRRAREMNAQFFLTDAPGAPFVTGFARPRIFLPSNFFQLFSVEQQRFVIRHELAHWVRLDLWVRSAWEGLRALFWFNPLVHVGAYALRVDQELACDQSILGGCDDRDRYHYGQALLVGASEGQSLSAAPSFWVAQKERILMVARHRKSFGRNLAGFAVCGALALLAFTEAPQLAAQDRAAPPINPVAPLPAAQTQATQPTNAAAPPQAPVATPMSAENLRIIEERVAATRGLSGTTFSSTERGVTIRGRAEVNTRVSDLLRNLSDAGFSVDVLNIKYVAEPSATTEFTAFVYSRRGR